MGRCLALFAALSKKEFPLTKRKNKSNWIIKGAVMWDMWF